MKKIIITSIMLLICIFTYSQETMKNLNFIIVIDDEIIEGGITGFIVDDKYSTYYYPGNLSISQFDYDKMISDDNNETLCLSFTYDNYSTDKEYTYEIELSKRYFKEHYSILEIYNLDKKKYKKAFKTYAKGKHLEYVHQIRSSGGAALIVRDK